MAKLTEEQVQQVMDIIQSTPAPLVPKTVREYIGARYVPVFANPLEWSDTREYEPLTIVTYQGNSYTSMQYVPTGIEITNTSFWALTGNYNAQIEAYRQEVQAFDGRITQNETALKPLISTGVFTYEPGKLSWLGYQNTKYSADNGTRFYIIPKSKVTQGVGGAVKIFGDNYPNSDEYRDMGLYFSADQNSVTGYHNTGAFYINVKNEGYAGNPDLIMCFDEGLKPLIRFIDGPNTPFVYIGEGSPTFTNPSGAVFFKMEVDGNFLIPNPYRLFVGASNSIYETTESALSVSTSEFIVNAGGNVVIDAIASQVKVKQNLAIDGGTLGLILTSPNGTKYKVTVSNDGQLTSTPYPN